MPADDPVYVGTRVAVTAEFRDEDDALGDPGSVIAETRSPSGVETTYTYGVDSALTRLSLGRFKLQFPAGEAERWWVRIVGSGTGPNVAIEDYVDVEPSHFT